MKSKKATYFLLAAVFVIWGTIVVRIIAHIRKPDEDPINRQYNMETSNNLFSKDSAIVVLKLNYPDPFLKYNYTAIATANTTQQTGNKKNSSIRNRLGLDKNIQEKINWPEIKFSGNILNDKTGEKLGLIEIGGESFLIRNGDLKKEIEIIQVYADSVKLSYKNQSKTIIKTN